MGRIHGGNWEDTERKLGGYWEEVGKIKRGSLEEEVRKEEVWRKGGK